jgi:hypothetical protein
MAADLAITGKLGLACRPGDRRPGGAVERGRIGLPRQKRHAREVSDRVCVFYAGKIEEREPPDQIFSSLKKERTKQFLSAVLEAG